MIFLQSLTSLTLENNKPHWQYLLSGEGRCLLCHKPIANLRSPLRPRTIDVRKDFKKHIAEEHPNLTVELFPKRR